VVVETLLLVAFRGVLSWADRGSSNCSGQARVADRFLVAGETLGTKEWHSTPSDPIPLKLRRVGLKCQTQGNLEPRCGCASFLEVRPLAGVAAALLCPRCC
jgi:hypothetical protein